MSQKRALRFGGALLVFLAFLWVLSGTTSSTATDNTPPASFAGSIATNGLTPQGDMASAGGAYVAPYSPVQGYVDVSYDFSIPDMPIPAGGQVVCYFDNGDVITMSDTGSESLRITGTLSHEDFVATLANIDLVDANRDGWVKLADAGNISVAYDRGAQMWKADWLRGCP